MAKKLFLVLSISWCLASFEARAVLDPALYLSPSPPLTGQPEAMTQWARALVPEELTREADLVEEEANVEEEEEPKRARTFWPLRSSYGIKAIHIPLTFSLTGSYGSNGGATSGVIGSSYATVSDDGVKYGKSGLAGSSYGVYRGGSGTRIYGSPTGAAWSGWGNGKWGHYGKG